MDRYFIEADYGKLGIDAALNYERSSKQHIIEDLTDGEHDMPLAVYRFNMDEGHCGDVSEDIAREIAQSLEYTPGKSLMFFLERHLPIDEMNDLVRGFRDAAE